jgi:hypothetical protein
MMVLQMQDFDRKVCGNSDQIGTRILRLKTNARAIDHNVITQSAAMNGRVV